MAAGIAGSADHEAYPGELQEGQRIVSDVLITGEIDQVDTWVLRDRPARDDEDLGEVYRGGEVVGKVESVEGSLVVYREL